MSKPPDWLTLVATSVAARVLVVAAACLTAGTGLSQHVLLHDGWEYLRLGQAFALWAPGTIEGETLRLFPGYPAAIALLSLGRLPGLVGLALAIGCAAACGPLVSRLGDDRRLGWWLVAVTPTWLLYTSTVMSEGLFVLLTLVTLLSTLERRWWLAGLAAGLASTVRPVGAFLILLPILEILINRERGALPRCLGAAAPWPLLQMALSAAVWGNPLVTVNGYVEKDISLPLESLTTHLLSAEVGLDKKALVLGSLALAITGAVGLALRRRRGLAGGRSLLIWQVLVILFCISLPSSWAFQSIDRFLVVIWPTTLIGLAPLLPRHRATHALLLVMLSALSAGIAIRWLVNLSKVFPFDERALPSALQVLGYN